MIGETIKQIRKKRGYSISQLAKMANVSKSYLSEIERGIQMNPSILFLKKISTVLDISYENLLERTSGGIELDEEWITLIEQAIKDGFKKEDFLRCQNCLLYKKYTKK